MHQTDLDIFLNENVPDYHRQLEMLMFMHPGKFHVDLMDGGDHYDLIAEFPGIPKDCIHLDVDGDMLTLRAECEPDEEHASHDYVKRERHAANSGVYVRQFNVSRVDKDNIKASYKYGLLKVVLPKKAGAASSERKISIDE